jgi:hypothetical protein
MQGRETGFSAFSANGDQPGIRGVDVPERAQGLEKRLITVEVGNFPNFFKIGER